MWKCCLNPRVIASLGLIAVGVLVFSPHAFAVALPVLLGLICPLSMIAMAVMMARGARSSTDEQAPATEDRREEMARLRAEIDELRRAGTPR